VTNNETVWTKTGYSDLNNLGRALEKHNKSKEHIAFACKFVLFGKQNIALFLCFAQLATSTAFRSSIFGLSTKRDTSTINDII
jgi:hypothetical protein